MSCIEESTDKYWCKNRDGVLYLDDFTSPLAGRWTVLADDGVDGWQIVDASTTYDGDVGSSWYETVYGTKLLRVNHNVVDAGDLWRIRNDEFPNPYVLDDLGRDYPWFSVRIGTDHNPPVNPSPRFGSGFPYDRAWGGMEHKIQSADHTKRFGAHHMHLCGLFSTWVYIRYFVDGSYVDARQLVNLMWQYWYLKHYVSPEEVYFTQGKPQGWSVGTDSRYVDYDDQVYTDVNGNFGLISQHCGSWSADSYVYYHGLVICETNYITITNIPPNPNGANALPGIPEGVWRFKMVHPEIGNAINNTDTYTPNDESEITISFGDHNFGWQKIQLYVEGDGGTTLITEFAPSDYVNGGDIYCLDVETQNAAVVCDDGPPEPPPPPPPPETPPPTTAGPTPVSGCSCEGGIHVDTGECQAGIDIEC